MTSVLFSKQDILQYRLRNKPKSLLSHLLRIFFVGFLHIYTSHLTTFLKIENVENFKKNVKRDLNKKNAKNVYYICATDDDDDNDDKDDDNCNCKF